MKIETQRECYIPVLQSCGVGTLGGVRKNLVNVSDYSERPIFDSLLYTGTLYTGTCTYYVTCVNFILYSYVYYGLLMCI